MRIPDRPITLAILSALPGLAMLCAVLLHLLPYGILTILTVWTLLSVPCGILIGSCVLNDK